jgi:polygalacturonase
VQGSFIRFTVRAGQQVSVEPYGDTGPILHLFANPIEQDVPSIDDPNVLFYGPGEHEISSLRLKSGQTLYLAGGAVLTGIVAADERPYREEKRKNITLHRYDHLIWAEDADNITIKGRGVIDCSRLADRGARKNPIHLTRCTNIKVEGIIIKEATCWNLTMYRCEGCIVENVKEISGFYNSDGINAVSCSHVVIRSCFLRQRDDGIAVKAMDTGNTDCFIHEPAKELPGGQCTHIQVKDCIIWSDWGYALGVTYEIRKDVHDIVFENCRIIHATHNNRGQGVLGVLVSDECDVYNVAFKNITVERSLKPLIKLNIARTAWTVSERLGRIYGIHFENIELLEGERQPVILSAHSPESDIRDIIIERVSMRGERIRNIPSPLLQIGDYCSSVSVN